MKAIDYATPSKAESSHCAVVFVHGLLGSHQDWQPVAQLLPQVRCVGVDLPGHGRCPCTQSVSFDSISQDFAKLCHTLVNQGADQLILVGYSLGSRVLMFALANGYLDIPQLHKVIIEGGNFGLQSQSDRQARISHDEQWANRFSSESAEVVLDSWYRQTVFADLDQETRQKLIQLRAQNDLDSVASMLRATSLGRQPYLLPKLQKQQLIQLLVGERDSKFKAMYKASGIPTCIVPAAGHNSHKQNPRFVADAIMRWL